MSEHINDTTERELVTISGYLIIMIWLCLIAALAYFFLKYLNLNQLSLAPFGILTAVFSYPLTGLFTVMPFQSVIGTRLGPYVGTVQEPGFYWRFPLVKTEKIDLGLRTDETENLTINDSTATPVVTAATLTYKVSNSYLAHFKIEGEIKAFVINRLDAALREVVGSYPYEQRDLGTSNLNRTSEDEEVITLSGSRDAISRLLKEKLIEKLHDTGIEVIEINIKDLRYPPEIAASMLKRQTASAELDARTIVAKGSVKIAKEIVHLIEHPEDSQNETIKLGDEEKQKLVSNLVTLIASSTGVTPVLTVSS